MPLQLQELRRRRGEGRLGATDWWGSKERSGAPGLREKPLPLAGRAACAPCPTWPPRRRSRWQTSRRLSCRRTAGTASATGASQRQRARTERGALREQRAAIGSPTTTRVSRPGALPRARRAFPDPARRAFWSATRRREPGKNWVCPLSQHRTVDSSAPVSAVLTRTKPSSSAVTMETPCRESPTPLSEIEVWWFECESAMKSHRGGGRQRTAAGGELQVVDGGSCGNRERPAGVGAASGSPRPPDADRPINSAGHEEVAARTDGEGGHGADVPSEGDDAARWGSPDRERPAKARNRDLLREGSVVIRAVGTSKSEALDIRSQRKDAAIIKGADPADSPPVARRQGQ